MRFSQRRLCGPRGRECSRVERDRRRGARADIERRRLAPRSSSEQGAAPRRIFLPHAAPARRRNRLRISLAWSAGALLRDAQEERPLRGGTTRIEVSGRGAAAFPPQVAIVADGPIRPRGPPIRHRAQPAALRAVEQPAAKRDVAGQYPVAVSIVGRWVETVESIRSLVLAPSVAHARAP